MGNNLAVGLLQIGNGTTRCINNQFAPGIFNNIHNTLHPKYKAYLIFRPFRDNNNGSFDSCKGLNRFVNKGRDITASKNAVR